VRGLEPQDLWGAAEGTEIVQSGDKVLRGDLTALYNDLKGGWGEVGVSLFSQVTTIR